MFQYYKQESRIFPFRDYQALMEQAAGLPSVLEFGPGWSTWALIEAGVEHIVTLEHVEVWYKKAAAQFAGFPQVTVLRYKNLGRVEADIDPGQQFNLAYVDSPVGTPRLSRRNTMLYAMRHAPVVLLHDADRKGELDTLRSLGQFSILPDSKIARICRSEIPAN